MRGVALIPVLGLIGCSTEPARFPLREPMTRDTDLAPFRAPCRTKESGERVCAPNEYVSPLVWDGADNLVFRPLAESLAVEGARESINVNSVDEVPDSAWFTGRLGVSTFGVEELRRGACSPEQLLHPDGVPVGAWLIDQGKTNGATEGFRVIVEGRKYLFKSDAPLRERPSAASVIGAAAYHAVGFFTSCEQVVYFEPAALRLQPGLRSAANFQASKAFDRSALERILSKLSRRGSRVRMQASAWLSGKPLGPFRYEGTRDDDPNDVIPHQHRRELRGGRLLAAWLDHFDAREQNTMDTWIAEGKAPDAPGRIIHHYLDTSDCLGSEWAWDGISRRLGRSYVFDWGDVASDFVTLGIRRRPWELVRRTEGREQFGYFESEHFVPEDWKMEYPNPAFSRMTERDGAWMARKLSRFTPEMVRALAELGQFADPGDTEHVARVLEERLLKILRRYLTRLSPLADVEIDGERLCAVDLAKARKLRPAGEYRYRAALEDGAALPVEMRPNGAVCASLQGVEGDYVRLRMTSSAARGPLIVHLRRGDSDQLRLVGLERPE